MTRGPDSDVFLTVALSRQPNPPAFLPRETSGNPPGGKRGQTPDRRRSSARIQGSLNSTRDMPLNETGLKQDRESAGGTRAPSAAERLRRDVARRYGAWRARRSSRLPTAARDSLGQSGTRGQGHNGRMRERGARARRYERSLTLLTRAENVYVFTVALYSTSNYERRMGTR